MLTNIPTGKRPLGRPRRTWEDNIRIDLKELGINTRNWVDSNQDRDDWRALVNTALNLRVTQTMELVIMIQDGVTCKLTTILFSAQFYKTMQEL